jgi:predicted TIM-barrel fold metal-dependent hydrolase
MLIDFGVSCSGSDLPQKESFQGRSVLLCAGRGERFLEDDLHLAAARASESVIPFPPLQPDSQFALEYVWKCSDEELLGLSFQPMAPFCASDPRFFRVYDLVRALGLVAVFAPLSGLPGSEYISLGPEDVSAIYACFPGIRIAAECRGGAAEARALLTAARGEDLYIMTSSLSGTESGDSKICGIVGEFGADRLLFSSGSSVRSAADELAFIESLSLRPEEKSLILGGNGARILGLDR